jgi:hypothetical protein
MIRTGGGAEVRMSARVYGLGVVFWAWLAAGCGEGGDREVTWHRDVRPIAAAMCADCHTDSAAVPFDVQDPAAVAEWADPIVASVLARSMPPWGMDASCREVPGSRWLSDAQLDTFRAWRDGGFELGDAADYVAPPPPPPSGAEALGAPDQVVVLDPYTPDTSGPDDYLSNNFPSVNELLQHQKNGLIYKNVEDAVYKLQLLNTETAQRKQLVENAFQFVQQFDITLMNQRIADVYKSIFTHA